MVVNASNSGFNFEIIFVPEILHSGNVFKRQHEHTTSSRLTLKATFALPKSPRAIFQLLLEPNAKKIAAASVRVNFAVH